MIQLFIPLPVEEQKRWYGFVSGNSYVNAVEFGDGVRALSVNGSGQSTDPTSPHYRPGCTLRARRVQASVDHPGRGAGQRGAVVPAGRALTEDQRRMIPARPLSCP